MNLWRWFCVIFLGHEYVAVFYSMGRRVVARANLSPDGVLTIAEFDIHSGFVMKPGGFVLATGLAGNGALGWKPLTPGTTKYFLSKTEDAE